MPQESIIIPNPYKIHSLNRVFYQSALKGVAKMIIRISYSGCLPSIKF